MASILRVGRKDSNPRAQHPLHSSMEGNRCFRRRLPDFIGNCAEGSWANFTSYRLSLYILQRLHDTQLHKKVQMHMFLS